MFNKNWPRAVSRSASVDSTKNLCCLSEASYIDFSCRNVRQNERSVRSLDFWFFASRQRTIIRDYQK
jgi:hypothetical protein